MAFIACLKPSSIAGRTVLPWSSSSRMRSKISTFASTAMPIESTKPASPGSVSVASNPASAAEREQDVERQRHDGEDAVEAVVDRA